MTATTSYRGYVLLVHSQGVTVYDSAGNEVGRAWSMSGARSLVKKLRRAEGKQR